MCLTELFQGQTASVGLSRMVVDNSALGVNFINILHFHSKIVLLGFSLTTVWHCNILAKEYREKLLVKCW